MFFNQRNGIIIFTIMIFLIYLTLPCPIVLVENKNNKQFCYNNCNNCNSCKYQ